VTPAVGARWSSIDAVRQHLGRGSRESGRIDSWVHSSAAHIVNPKEMGLDFGEEMESPHHDSRDRFPDSSKSVSQVLRDPAPRTGHARRAWSSE